MDANTNANFANAAQIVPCPKCGAANKPGGRFCIACGSPMAAAAANASAFAPMDEAVADSAPAFETVAEPTAPAFDTVAEPAAPTAESAPAEEKKVEPETIAAEEPEPYDDEKTSFANGLPAWDMVPPQVMVRRRQGK